MKFNHMPYERVDYNSFAEKYSELLEKFNRANSSHDQLEILKETYRLREEYGTMSSLAYIRHTVNTQDAFYAAEKDYYNRQGPLFTELFQKLTEAMLTSKFRDQLEEELGSVLFENAELNQKAFDESIIEDLQQENELTSCYTKLMASAKIQFNGRTLNLAQLGYYMAQPQRELRRQAYAARTQFFMAHNQEFDNIFDQLVKVRTRLARKLGYDNFVDVGYFRMTRNSYGPDDVAGFRAQVKKYVVPLTKRLYERQRKRLGLNKLMFFDANLCFKEGNPAPIGTPQKMFENARTMYHEMAPETGEFFDFMMDNELFDVLSKPGKAIGGYCAYLTKYKSPFIFANFNGTHSDVDVLTHEAGHAFMSYLSGDIYPPDNRYTTAETSEIHSMSMEYLAWPWMHLFFGQDADKYRFMHLSNQMFFLPSGCAVDEFQHIIYSNPDMTPGERKEVWKNLEETYQPHLDFDDDPFFGEGGTWQRYLHIYELPFYYIDYCIAQVCALQNWRKSLTDRDSAWDGYVKLCRAAGTKKFTNLIEDCGLVSPFEDGCMEDVVSSVGQWLGSVDV